MSQHLTLTCRDTDDAAYWAERLQSLDQAGCEILLDLMFGLRVKLLAKGIPTPGVDDRLDQGAAIYLQRFGEGYISF